MRPGSVPPESFFFGYKIEVFVCRFFISGSSSSAFMTIAFSCEGACFPGALLKQYLIEWVYLQSAGEAALGRVVQSIVSLTSYIVKRSTL